ncbi:MAG: tRNA (adenosine(37)-N6)-threonylcarbamoyltransferase complex ATPase subunit type 1 TsaE [Oscillospiraceae bacterium]|jgi:tRNA threonylcarbamoyladenosine biosynthesis protein TsaE|nr:tRNA (adenosine(37)-N6)-threonylcarbamoyltransferase complex ATPase subunit type 1 TsaE [Oscillospiraceae bacterium]
MCLTHTPHETEALGEALAHRLAPGEVVALFGGLGAGKTAFVRGLAAGLGCTGEVSSPTYALVHEYPGKLPLAHFDMYRIEGWDALESTGWYAYLEGAYVLAVEWSEHIAAALPKQYWRVEIAPGPKENTRVVTITQKRAEEDTA